MPTDVLTPPVPEGDTQQIRAWLDEHMPDSRPLTLAQRVINELSDYERFLEDVSIVYDHITHGAISKPNTKARSVIAVADDVVTALVEEEVADRLRRAAPAVTPPEGKCQHHAETAGRCPWCLKCDEPAKSEVGPMPDAESRSGVQALESSGSSLPAAPPVPEGDYNARHEARRVCEAIGSNVGHGTVMSALHEAFEAGRGATPAVEGHHCSGCGHRWEGPLHGAELCGDCWRRVQPDLHGPAMDWWQCVGGKTAHKPIRFRTSDYPTCPVCVAPTVGVRSRN